MNPITVELLKLAKRGGGLVTTDAVIEAARPVDSPMHDKFTWNLRKAAEITWRWQARELIAQYWIVEANSGLETRMLISIESDRIENGGYRLVADVLANPEQRSEWLSMAIDDLVRWQRRYAVLTELRPIFTALAKFLNRKRAA